jgi:glucosamine--fructose-6-phosphate aminotransferase (isomerizing)
MACRDNLEKFLNADRIIIACGTSWHAGLVAEYVFEEFAFPVEVEYASEFRYRNPIKQKISLLLFLNLEADTHKLL